MDKAARLEAQRARQQWRRDMEDMLLAMKESMARLKAYKRR